MTFWSHRIVSTIDSVNSGFCSRLISSSWKSVQLGVFLLGFCPSWESRHMTFCPRKIVSNIGSVHSGFCPRVVLSNWDYVHLGVCLL